MNSLVNDYFTNIKNLLDQILSTQNKNIGLAADIIADAVMADGWLYVFGTGHSHMIAEELFYRAGGLVRVYPILDTALMLHEGAVKSSALERLSGYAKCLLEDYPVTAKDAILIVSNSGRNAIPVEMALEAKARGLTVIALTNLSHSQAVSSRHSSGKRLFEIADVVINTCGEIGDASLEVNDIKIGPTSTVTGSAIVNALIIRVAEIFAKNNFSGEFFVSSNTDNGEVKNLQYIAKYKNFVRSL